MMKAFLLTSLVVSASSFADEANTVLNCVQTKGDQKPAYMLTKSQKNPTWFTFTNLNSGKYDSAPPSVDLRVLAKTNLNEKYGNLIGADPVVALVAVEKVGQSYLNLALNSREGVLQGEFKSGYNSTNITCTQGKDFQNYTALAQAAPLMDALLVREFWDESLALSCHKKNDPKPLYLVRAIHDRFGSVNLMLNSTDGIRPGAFPTFQSMSFGRKDNFVFKNEDPYNVFTGKTLQRFYLTRKHFSRNHERLHSATFVPDLHNPDLAMEDLTCAERQAYPNIKAYAADAIEAPQELPSTPGTLAQVDLTLCGKENTKGDAAARKVSEKWSHLIMKMPLPQGSAISMVGMNYNRSNYCLELEIDLSSDEAVTAAKGILGDSLEGIRIKYSAPKKPSTGGNANAK